MQRQTAVKNRLKVTGEGSISVPPDRVELILGVITESVSVREAQGVNSSVITAIIAAILELGVPETMIQSSSYRIDPQYDYIDGKEVFRHYRVAHLLKITNNKVDITGNIVDVAVENGANSIASIQFTIRNSFVFYQQALAKAVENALNKARTIAKSLDVSLSEIPVSVNEISSQDDRIPSGHSVLYASTNTPIQEGVLTITATVEVEFYYEQ